MSIHYYFGGSTAGRTKTCPAWHNLAKNMPNGKASFAALVGTLLHLLFERGMTDPEFEPASLVGDEMIIEGTAILITAEMIEKVYTAFECQIEIEEKYLFTNVYPEVVMNTDDETGGTADIIAYRRHAKTCITFAVGDLKTGDGHMVYAKDNDQLLFYAWQAVEKYKSELKFTDKTLFVLYIIQPSDRRDDPVDIWETDLKTIMQFAAQYKQARKMAKAGIKEPCPGDHCAYCPAMPVCPAKTGEIKKLQRIPKESKELKDLTWAMSVVDEAEAWCRAVRKTAHEQAEQGVKLAGFKLVQKRAVRQWKDEAAIHRRFKASPRFKAEEYLDQKLKTAPAMEKVYKTKNIAFSELDSMIHLQSSGTTLVKDTDKRPEALPLGAMQLMSDRLK